ncbi:aspartate aminotransferase family protein [Bacillus sp. B15-48]|uniref:aspartate aminotransferase family protein n=1 Tax=Bacillus sp. B15-48 TaxID=1548601 RepID=UPI00193F7B30|nr:aspartate aminotransferase family protein [Bacillus sp. B15-48]MBM4762025.1 aspartate aminotransferase family protein [Bacillus sp. B15-48]
MDRTYLIKPMLDEVYPVIDYGKGIYLFDRKGKRYLDGASGAVTANIGHGVEEIIEAMCRQAKKVSFVYRSQFTSEAAESLAERIAQLMPGDLNWSFFVNSGSEAIETAMKIAIQYWQEKGRVSKTKFISRWISYHGITNGALSMSGHTNRRSRFASVLADYPVISPPYCYRCPYNKKPDSCGLECAEELDLACKRIGAESIAAFIAEPIVGAAGGALTPPKGYYSLIEKICEENDILFIADEVMTGFGRTGKMLASEHYHVVPDIVSLGKGMGAGYAPIAATLVSEKVIAPIKNGSRLVMSGHTLSANPQSCATALAVINYLNDKQIIKEVETKGIYLKNLLTKLKAQFSIIGEIRGMGLLLGIELVQDAKTKKSFPLESNITGQFVNIAQKKGLLVYPASAGLDGTSGDAVIISPPLTITKREIEELVSLIKSVLTQLTETTQYRGAD